MTQHLDEPAPSPRWERALGHPYTLAALCGLCALVVYLLTAWKGVGGRFMPVDSAGHQYYGRVVGPFNSAWHPLYYTITWLWERMRLAGTRADQITLLSSVMGGLAVSLVFLLCHRLTASRFGAAVAALSLAFGGTFWTQATDAEVYTMQAACVAGVFLLLLRWRDTGRVGWYLGACFLYAQSFGVHLMMGLLLPSFVFLVFSTDPGVVRRPGATALVVLFVAAGLAQYAGGYLQDWPHEHLAWGVDAPRDLDGYVWTVFGDHWKGAMFAYKPSEMLLDRFPLFLWLWNLQASLVGVALAIGGLPHLFRRDQKGAYALVLGAILTAVYAISYDVIDPDVFLIPVYVLLAPSVAAAAAWLLAWVDPRRRWMIPAAAFAWIGALVAFFAPAMAQDHNPFEPVRRLLERLEPGALIVNPGQPWEETMVWRNFFFNEPRLFAKGQRYIESVEVVPKGKRRHLHDPDVEIPRALERGGPVYVSQSDLSAAASCPLQRLETTLEDIALKMEPTDLVALVWQHEGRVVDDATRRGLERLHLDGHLAPPRPLHWVGIGCVARGCKGVEGSTRDLSVPLWAETREGQELGGGARSPVPVRVGIVRGGFGADGKIEVAGDDALVPQRREITVGFPRRRSGTTHIVHNVLSYERTITGSAAVVIDGATGRVKARYYTERGALAFDHKVSVCRLEPREVFDAGGVVDFGDLVARAYLGTGFWIDAFDGGRTAVSSHGPESTVWLPMRRPQRRYRVRLAVRSMFDDPTQRIALTVNGVQVAEWTLAEPGFQTYEADVPDGAFKAGINRVHLAYARPRTPLEVSGGFAVDRRMLAVSLDRLDLVPLGGRHRLELAGVASRPHLEQGFGPTEWMGAISAAWSAGTARVALYHDEPGAPAALRFYARSHEAVEAGQLVRVTLNGQRLGAVPVRRDWGAHAVAVPAGLLRAGKNHLVLEPARDAIEPAPDRVDLGLGALHRHMGVAFERIELVSGLDDDGRLDPGAIALYGQGFATPEADPKASWIWATAREATLVLPMARARERVTLRVRAHAAGPAPQDVTVVLNGKPAGTLSLGRDKRDHALELGPLAAGPNELRLRFGHLVPPGPGEPRTLAASFDWIELAP